MGSATCEKGQSLVTMCLLIAFIMSVFITGISEVYKKTQIHINQIEDRNFWSH